jgi:hypothetical protein
MEQSTWNHDYLIGKGVSPSTHQYFYQPDDVDEPSKFVISNSIPLVLQTPEEYDSYSLFRRSKRDQSTLDVSTVTTNYQGASHHLFRGPGSQKSRPSRRIYLSITSNQSKRTLKD